MRESDRAYEELVEYFSAVDEKTVILMFGDHQPYNSVAQPLLAHCGTVLNTADLVEGKKRYITPYIFWSNFDIEWTCPEDLSANYLSTVLVNALDLPKTDAQKFLLDLIEDYPVITARCLIDSQGNYTSADEFSSIPRVNDYSIMQYNLVFDQNNSLDEFWMIDCER